MILSSLLVPTAALAAEQQVLGDVNAHGISGFDLARKLMPASFDDLADSVTKSVTDFELLRHAWDDVFKQNPAKVLAALQPKDSPVRSQPPPLRISRKDGFTVHKHVNFPDYELRVKDPGPELGIDDVRQYSGYIDVLSEDKHFFFWLYESRGNPKKDPVVLWINGGPGCSSSTGEFFELGPSMITKNLTMERNPYSWNEAATVIFLDQPVNVGYSYSSQRVGESTVAGEDVYSFLEILFDALPQYAGLPFHISGESYAGKYLPAIGGAILNHPERTFNLSSALIGNPITDPAIQAFSSVAMACGDGGYPSIYSDEECYSLYEKVPNCERLMYLCYDSDQNFLTCGGASLYCAQLEEKYLETGRNPYDISDQCGDSCYPEIDSIEDYLRQPEVIKAVGSDVDDFVGCSNSVGADFAAAEDHSRSEIPDVLRMLEAGIDVLFYDGALDWICSWPGVYHLVERLRYEHHAEFNAKPVKVWEVDGEPAGETKSAGNLHWMKVYGAGHMVPHDKGKQALAMLKQWLKKREFE